MKTPGPSSRRSFLGKISAASAALALAARTRGQTAATPAATATASNGKKLGVVLCGLGSYATGQLAPALQLTQQCRLVGVVTGSRDKGLAWAKQYGFPEKNIYNYGTMARMIDNPDIDIVYVVTPNALHAEHVTAAAWAGKHVITEKPMANSVSDCNTMLAACRAAGVKLSVGYRLQFEPRHQEMTRLAQDKAFGPFTKLSGGLAFTMNRPQWRAEHKLAGGGPLMDLGIYAVQAACMAAGTPGVAPVGKEQSVFITAREHPKKRPEFFRDVEEGLDWTMEFANGAKGEFMTSYNGGLDRFRAEGEHGWIEIAPAFQYGGLKVTTSKGPLNVMVPERQQVAQMDDFALCVRENRPTKVPGELGRRDMVIIEAIYASAKAAGKRIEVKI